MRRAILIFAWMAWLTGPGARHASAQAPAVPAQRPASAGGAQTVDAVAARIEEDILTESEVRELGAFQQLVDGHVKPRDVRIRELADQWILRGEAETAQYPQPSPDDVSHAYAQLAAQFASSEEFRRRYAAVGLTDAAVRRMVGQQLYLSRFVDYRFRPAAQVNQDQIEMYYSAEFAPQLTSRGQPVPPLESVEDTIREVLIQREITDRATQWLDETRERLKIDVMPQGDRP